MRKEVAVFGFIAVSAVAFILGRATLGGGSNSAESDKGAITAVKGDSDILPVGNSVTKGGGADAPVTIIEFSEFQCPFCSRVNPTMKQIADTYGNKVRVVFKHNPLPFHKDAPLASEASLAAHEQGKFWEMHDKLFENQKALTRPDLETYATAIGLDMVKFKGALDSNKFKSQVELDAKLAAKVGARGTPNFFVNGTQLTGARPFDAFKTIIDEQIKAAEELTKAGTKPTDVYAALVKKNFKTPAAQADAGGPKEDDKTVYKVPAGDSYFKGAKDAQVTILEFSEFQCPFCSRVNPTIKQALDAYPGKIKVVFKHSPLPFHKDAPLASEASLAAGAQGKFWEMHDKLFENQKALTRPDLDRFAGEIGLDMSKFKADLDGNVFKKAVDADMAISAQFGVQGTPNFFINGRKLVGAQPWEAFKKIIDEEITKTDILLKAGTSLADIYAKVTENGLSKAAAPAARDRGEAPNDTTVYKVPVATEDAVKGPADALVTIVEFSEFQCPFCSRVLPTTKQIFDTYGKDVRVIFKHAPLPFHADAPLASEAALAAGAQGKFWEYHDVLFANQKDLKRESLDKFAGQVGLNMGKFKADLDSNKFKAQVERDKALATSIGAGGTPNFYVNGRNLVGAQPFEAFKKIIDEELVKAKALVAKGTARSAVYAELTKNGATSKAAGPARPAEDDTKVYDIKVGSNDPFKGGKKAAVTIIEFSDFECPFCSRVNPTMKQIEDAYGDKVRVVFKQNPLSFHKNAPLAAEATLAAHEQGKFWQMHDTLFANQKALTRPDLDKYAQEIGLNTDKFKAALDTNKFKPQVEADMAVAKELGATGTPSFFVNGRKLRGAQPFESFKKLIDEALATKGGK
ncbi:MAG: thioredoxin [Myxococcales bacterium]|nr:thioredoxin [Myxococcales bacterium]